MPHHAAPRGVPASLRCARGWTPGLTCAPQAGNPFWSLPSLQDGNLVYIETRLNNYTYRVIGKKWVAPTDTAVLDPVPSHPRQRPTRRLVTLITCDPAWTGTHRVIVTGVLVAARPR